MKTYRTIATWPKHPDLYLGNALNQSTDEHYSKESAEAVAYRLRMEGFGGDGKIFPLKVEVEKIEHPMDEKVDLVIKGLTRLQAITLCEWYEGQGEQNQGEWFSVQNVKAPLTDVCRRGGYMDQNGSSVVMYLHTP